jgi:deoxyribodipyrimidine photo-lyase
MAQEMRVDERRIRVFKNEEIASDGPIVYWMNRDMRLEDNWALIHAQDLALVHERPLVVIYNLVPGYLGGTARQYRFKLAALRELADRCEERGIAFELTVEEGVDEVVRLLKKWQAAGVVTDFCPLRLPQTWLKQVGREFEGYVAEVDTHNIVPCWVASPKREVGAYTLRPKINKLLPEFLTDFPKVKKHPWSFSGKRRIDWAALERVEVDESVAPVEWCQAGEKAAQAACERFVRFELDGYATRRNDPNDDGQSRLSPYLHYGLIAPQRVALEVKSAHKPWADKEAFLEELIVRRELSDNFCFYEPHYDRVEAWPAWAQASHAKHAADARDYIYTQGEFERAETHDPLWNAAQKQMVETGKMHGYMRMYWAKKILEWSRTPEQALKVAIYLNDKYELDGRDPNGYAGIAWSMGGVHDRPWPERKVFGVIRSMTFNGAKTKFKVKDYIATWGGEVQGALI